MIHLRLLISFCILCLASTYFLLNVRQLEATTGLYFLLASAVCGLILLWLSGQWRMLFLPKRPTVLLAIFGIYYCFCYFTDTLAVGGGSATKLYDSTIGVTGGIFFGVAFGQLLALSLTQINIGLTTPNRSHATLWCQAAIIYCILVLVYSYATLEHNAEHASAHQFLIEEWGGAYQRAGDLVLIQYMIVCSIVAQIYMKRTLLSRLYLILAASVFVTLTLVLLPLTQLLGSNAGLITTLGYFFTILIFMYAVAIRRSYGHLSVRSRHKNGNIAWRSIKAASVLFFAAYLAWLINAEYVIVDIDKYRISGFGSGELSSLSNRIELFDKNFMIQWGYSPVFGNTQADILTTGAGTYAHSFIALLSHLGIVGLTLFIIFIVSVFRSLDRQRSAEDDQLIIYRIFGLIFITAFALVATFYTWLPFWVAVGMLGMAIPSPR